MEYDIKMWKLVSKHDPNWHVVKFVILIQLEYKYGIIGHESFTDGKRIFDSNILKALLLKSKILNIIWGSDKQNDINKKFSRVCREMTSVTTDLINKN